MSPASSDPPSPLATAGGCAVLKDPATAGVDPGAEGTVEDDRAVGLGGVAVDPVVQLISDKDPALAIDDYALRTFHATSRLAGPPGLTPARRGAVLEARAAGVDPNAEGAVEGDRAITLNGEPVDPVVEVVGDQDPALGVYGDTLGPVHRSGCLAALAGLTAARIRAVLKGLSSGIHPNAEGAIEAHVLGVG